MTGFEHAFAGTLAYMGRMEEAVAVVRAIRDRYDGERRNPFDEAECGHHYARAMASWGMVPALTGFSYSAVERRITFARAEEGPVRWFWSTGDAWGSSTQRRIDEGAEVSLRVLGGQIAIERIVVTGVGMGLSGRPAPLRRGDRLTVAIPVVAGDVGRAATLPL